MPDNEPALSNHVPSAVRIHRKQETASLIFPGFPDGLRVATPLRLGCFPESDDESIPAFT